MKSLFRILTAILGIGGFLWLAGLFMFAVRIDAARPALPHQKTDAIIVLTGGNFRIETGMQLWSRDMAQELFITGVYKDVTQQEILSEWQGKMDLPACCMTLGYEATTTEGNAEETRKWVDAHNITSARLVTSTYHMPRALLEFRLAMPDLVLYAHPVEIKDYKPQQKMFWYLAFLEYHKFLWRYGEWLTGYELKHIKAQL